MPNEFELDRQALADFDALPDPAYSAKQREEDFRALAEFDALTGGAEREEVEDAAIKSRAEDANTLLDLGEPVAAPAVFAPPGIGTRDYLHNFSSGRLALAPKTIGDTKEATLNSTFAVQWYAQHPTAAREIFSSPDNQNQFLSHVRALTALNHDHPSPTEEREAVTAAYRDWAANENLRVFRGPLGITITEQGDPNIPDADLLQVWSKSSIPATLTPPEKDTFLAMGGTNFLSFYRNYKSHYVGRARYSKLVGQPLPYAPPKEGPAVALEDLAGHSPFLKNLLDKEAALKASPEQNFLGLNIRSDFTIRPVPAALWAVEKGGQLIDTALLGGLSRTIEGARESIESLAGATRQAISFYTGGRARADLDKGPMLETRLKAFNELWAKQVATDTAYGQDPQEVVNSLLASFPGADPKELSQQMFNGAQGFRDLAKFFGDVPIAGRVLGLTDPDSQEYVGQSLGVLSEDPAQLLLAGLGAAHWAKKARAGVSPIEIGGRRPPVLSKEAIADIERGPTYQETSLYARNLDDLRSHLGTIDDPAAARGIVDRTERTLNDTQVPLTAERLAASKVQIDKIREHLDKTSTLETLSDDAKKSLAGLADYVGNLNFFEQAFTVTGDINKSHSAALTRATENWLRTQLQTTQIIDKPIAIDHGLASTEKVFQIAEAGNQFLQRRQRLLQILPDVDSQLGYELEALQRQADQAVTFRRDLGVAWNQSITEAVDQFQKLETAGGEVLSANPVLRTKEFRAAHEALMSGSDNAIRALFTDSKTRRALENPEFMEALRATPEADRAQLFRIRVADFVEDAMRPVSRLVQPSTKPRTRMAESIRERMAALKEGETVRLSKEELAALNEYRAAPIKQPTVSATKRWDQILENILKELDSTSALRKDAADLTRKIEASTPETGLAIPAKLIDRLADKLSLLDAPEVRRLAKTADPAEVRAALRRTPEYLNRDREYSALHPDRDLLSAKDALLEAAEGLSEDWQNIMSDMARYSAFEMNALHSSGRTRAFVGPALRDAAENAAGLQNWSRYQSELLNRRLGKEVTSAKERQQLLRDLRDGRLPKDKTAPSYELIQKQRRDFLDRALRLHDITAEEYHSLIRSDYYHGVFDRTTRARLDAAQKATGPLVRLSDKFAPLRMDPVQFKHKIPETYYVTWKAGKDVKFKEGFDSAEAAKDWLEKTFPDGAEASVQAPWTFDDKLMDGLIGEAGTSALTLNERMGRWQLRNDISRAVKNSGFVKSAAELGLPDDAGPAVKIGDEPWIRVEDTAAWPRRLRGKYVHSNVAGLLDEANVGFSFIDTLGKKLEEFTVPLYKNVLATPTGRVASAAVEGGAAGLSVFRNSLALFKLGIAPTAWMMGRMGNFYYSWIGGMPLTPSGIIWRAKGEWDYWRHVATGKSNLLLDGLYKRGYIQAPRGTEISKLAQASADKYWRSVDGAEAQASRIEAEMQKTKDPGRHAALAIQRQKWLNKAHKSAEQGYSDHAGRLMGIAQEALNQIWGTLRGKPTRLKQIIWDNLYDAASGDKATKYALGKFLMEHQGFSLEQALDHVGAFTPQLHQVPPSIKALTNKIGGAQFITFPYEQARVTINAARHRAGHLARSALLLSLWNSAVLTSQGIDEDQYLEAYAFSKGTKRSPLTDIQAKLRGIYLPTRDPEGGVRAVSLLPHVSSFLTPDAPWSRQVSEAILANTDNSFTHLLTKAAIGGVSKTVLAEPAIQSIVSLVSGRDEKGDPLRPGYQYMTDWAQQLYRTMSPDYAPANKDWERVSRIIHDQDIAPTTGHKTGIGEFLSQRLLKVQRLGTDDDVFTAAMTKVQKGSRNLSRYQSSERFDDLKSTLVVRGAQRDDGTINEEKARAIIEQWYKDNPAITPTLGGPIPNEPSEEDIDFATKNASKVGIERRFHRLSVDDEVAAYTLWRRHSSRAPARDLKATEIITDKLGRRSGLDKADLEHLIRVIDENLAAPSRLPQDVIDNLNFWRGRAQLKLIGARFE